MIERLSGSATRPPALSTISGHSKQNDLPSLGLAAKVNLMNPNGVSENFIHDNRKHSTSPRQELRRMQRLLYADVLSGATKPGERAQCARAWEVLEERKAILMMRPAPKPVEVPMHPKQKRPVDRSSNSAFEDPTRGAS